MRVELGALVPYVVAIEKADTDDRTFSNHLSEMKASAELDALAQKYGGIKATGLEDLPGFEIPGKSHGQAKTSNVPEATALSRAEINLAKSKAVREFQMAAWFWAAVIASVPPIAFYALIFWIGPWVFRGFRPGAAN